MINMENIKENFDLSLNSIKEKHSNFINNNKLTDDFNYVMVMLYRNNAFSLYENIEMIQTLIDDVFKIMFRTINEENSKELFNIYNELGNLIADYYSEVSNTKSHNSYVIC